MRDLIFVIKPNGDYEDYPLKKLRGQENYSDNFVVIANRVGIVKSNIKLLDRTDRVITQYLVPTLEKPADFIKDKPYFQEYADANVWRIAIDKKALQEISMSYDGRIEVSFSFLKLVKDARAEHFLGDLTGELPESATDNQYYTIRLAEYTKGDITWTYGQQAIWLDGAWIKGGAYRVEGYTDSHPMSVSATLVGKLPSVDTEKIDLLLQGVQDLNVAVQDTYRKDETYSREEFDALVNDARQILQDLQNLKDLIDDVFNISVENLQEGQILVYDGEKWTNVDPLQYVQFGSEEPDNLQEGELFVEIE